MNALQGFHPLVAQWFRARIGDPTELQARAWPVIAAGEHVLVTAPTGSGKTLAAFLWAVDRLVTGDWPQGRTSVLYVSPLKALNNDIQQNLLQPLAELKGLFSRTGRDFPPIRALTRSGDTPQSDRRHMQRHPPEILITTPESLNLLLSSPAARAILGEIRTVILDEVHAVAGNKRGVHLITAVDRLVPLSGEFQRIALSATVRPLETVAEFIGGLRLEGHPRAPQYVPRPVRPVLSTEVKCYELRVLCAGRPEGLEGPDAFWRPLVAQLKDIVARNRSTLVFTNSRRLCEKLTHLINQDEPLPLAYAHHGSLSREIRTAVERRLKAGELRAIVATHSLELGIDIGALDEVVLVQSPQSLSSAVQRLGRAGHRVGEVSRGTLFSLHPQDLVEAAVLAAGIPAQAIEPVEPVQCPLDVLAQILVSMVGVETWDVDALYGRIKTSYPYRALGRRHFDLVLEMLAGRYADSRLRELRPRIRIDRIDNRVSAAKGALQALYLSGGTIPDRGYFQLRHQDTRARIGELDEEFVWEASTGQTFTLGTQNWRIERITHNDVFVVPAGPRATAPPFWKGEEILRDFHLSEGIGRFLETLEGRLDEPDIETWLGRAHCLEPAAARELIAFLRLQKEATGSPLPHRHHLLVEAVSAGPDGYPGNQIVLHTLWGGRVNRPFAMALEGAWEGRFGQKLEIYVSNDCVLLQLPHDLSGEEVLSLVTPANVRALLRQRLESSGFFAARFRECAGRALLLTRRRLNERVPLWLSRLRSQRLLDAVLGYEDFPVLLEAWRTCLEDAFDLEGLIRVLGEIETGEIAWTEARTAHPSPMARGPAWRQINQYMYMDDEPASGRPSALRPDLLRELLTAPGLRASVSRAHVAEFERKRRRLSPGYAPDSAEELLEWVKERLLMPRSEWEALLKAAKQDHGLDGEALIRPIARKLLRLHPPGASEPLILALESLPRLRPALYGEAEVLILESLVPEAGLPDPAPRGSPWNEETREERVSAVLADWLTFCGPVSAPFILDTLGLEADLLRVALEDLVESGRIVTGPLVKESEEEVFCDSENFEILLRVQRARARPVFEPLDIQRLPLFVAWFQGIARPGEDPEELGRRIEQLVCHPVRVVLWESEILPARTPGYDPARLDTLIQRSGLEWIGLGNRQVCLCFEPDLELIRPEGKEAEEGDTGKDEGHGDLDVLFRDPGARYDFGTLLRASGARPAELAARLWEAAWQGRVTNDTFAALRQGIETDFRAADLPGRPVRPPARRRLTGRRTAFSAWRGSMPFTGTWRRVLQPPRDNDPIETQERNRERARLLLERYGILFRELLRNELPAFQWSALFRTLRIMELAGEVLTGYFFDGIPGPQFISREAFAMLRRKMPEERIFWFAAADPASLCGLPLPAFKGKLPRRVPGNHLVYHGTRLVLLSRRNGARLRFLVPQDDPHLSAYLGFLRHLLTRRFQPLRRVHIETINGTDAARSVYIPALASLFDLTADHRHVTIYAQAQ